MEIQIRTFINASDPAVLWIHIRIDFNRQEGKRPQK